MLNKQCIYIENKNNILQAFYNRFNYASNLFVDYYDYENVSRETFIRQILICWANVLFDILSHAFTNKCPDSLRFFCKMQL